MIRIFTYDFEHYCNLEPLGLVPIGSREIARGVFRLPQSLDASALTKVCDRFGVNTTDVRVKRQWQTFYQVRTLNT